MPRPEIDQEVINLVDEIIDEEMPLPAENFSTNEKLRMIIEEVYQTWDENREDTTTDGFLPVKGHHRLYTLIHWSKPS